ncbi:MAG: FMN-binding negative transcriptional regulator [Methylacidiphilales bacterium]|nr:FMN-binding negative transcriptional regulator [Candidatus Methylacidiphilales bacterium]
MYIPSAFEVIDPDKIAEVISSNSFATLISKDGDSLFASHLPFLHKPEQNAKGKLISHMARANRHWQLLNEKEEALVIFNGPHAYISPNWYATEVAVPTWNYVTVHVYGIPKIMQTEAELNVVLGETVEKYESGLPNPWIPNLPDELKAKLNLMIVGFEIEITRIEGKFKLGQNRSEEDQKKMRQTLQSSGDAESIRLATFMERELK